MQQGRHLKLHCNMSPSLKTNENQIKTKNQPNYGGLEEL